MAEAEIEEVEEVEEKVEETEDEDVWTKRFATLSAKLDAIQNTLMEMRETRAEVLEEVAAEAEAEARPEPETPPEETSAGVTIVEAIPEPERPNRGGYRFRVI